MAEYIYDFKEPPDPEGYRGRLIRCKDCKSWHAEGQYCDKFGVMWDEFYTSPNDYCSRGEKKEE